MAQEDHPTQAAPTEAPVPQPTPPPPEQSLDVTAPVPFVQRLKMEDALTTQWLNIQNNFTKWAWRYRENAEAYSWLDENLTRVVNQLDAYMAATGKSERFGFVKQVKVVELQGLALAVPKLMVRWGEIDGTMQKLGLLLTEKTVAKPQPGIVSDLLKLHFRHDPPTLPTDETEKSILWVAAYFLHRLKQNFDVFAAVDASKWAEDAHGIGKTELALILAHLIRPRFDVRRDVVYSDDFPALERTLKDPRKGAVYSYDEADQFFHMYDWMSPFSQDSIKLLKQVRKRGQVRLLCGSSVWDYNRYVRYQKINHRIRILKRGVAELWKRGGFQDEKKDKWSSRFICKFRWHELKSTHEGTEIRRVYDSCVRFTEKHGDLKPGGVSPLARKLEEDPFWPGLAPPPPLTIPELIAGQFQVTGNRLAEMKIARRTIE